MTKAGSIPRGLRQLVVCLVFAVLVSAAGCGKKKRPEAGTPADPARPATATADGNSPQPDIRQLAGVWEWERELSPTLTLKSPLRAKFDETPTKTTTLDQVLDEHTKALESSLRRLRLEITRDASRGETGGVDFSWHLKYSYAPAPGEPALDSQEGPLALTRLPAPYRLAESRKASASQEPLPRDTWYMIGELPPLLEKGAPQALVYHPIWLSADGQELHIDSVVLLTSPSPTVALSQQHIHGVFRKTQVEGPRQPE